MAVLLITKAEYSTLDINHQSVLPINQRLDQIQSYQLMGGHSYYISEGGHRISD